MFRVDCWSRYERFYGDPWPASYFREPLNLPTGSWIIIAKNLQRKFTRINFEFFCTFSGLIKGVHASGNPSGIKENIRRTVAKAAESNH